MSQVAITYDLKTKKIVVVPIGKTLSDDVNHLMTIAVVPNEKLDIAIGCILSYDSLIGSLALKGEISAKKLLELQRNLQETLAWVLEQKITYL